MGTLREDIDTNTANVAINAANIATNTADILALETDINNYDPKNIFRYVHGPELIIAGFKIVESASDTGTGTVSASVLTDTSKSWIPDQWIGFNILIDSVEYNIIDNDATTITVTGSPSAGSQAYTIHASGTGTVSGSVLTDSNRAWTTDQWKTNWVLNVDGTRYPITANTDTTITVTGSPSAGSQAYTIESMYLTVTAETATENTVQNEDYENCNIAYVDAYAVILTVSKSTCFASIEIETADATHPRYDLVYLTKNGTIVVSKGTPAADPVVPNTPNLCAPLANVYIAANEDYMESSNISDRRVYPNSRKRSVSFAPFKSNDYVTVGDGTIPVGIPSDLNGLNLIEVLAIVHTPGTTGNTTDIQLRRRRNGVDVDMLTSKIQLAVDVYSSSTCTIDTNNDDVLTGDIIYVDIDAVTDVAPYGLTVLMTFYK
ncbi:MAG: hypothetical protein ACTSQY_08260 [Candidatus Odinarchaeia archaeon]